MRRRLCWEGYMPAVMACLHKNVKRSKYKPPAEQIEEAKRNYLRGKVRSRRIYHISKVLKKRQEDRPRLERTLVKLLESRRVAEQKLKSKEKKDYEEQYQAVGHGFNVSE